MNDDLPAFGSEEASVKFINYKNAFFSLDHLSEMIINENKKINLDEIKGENELEEDE